MARRKPDDLIPSRVEKRIGTYNEGANALLDDRCKRSVDLFGRPGAEDDNLTPENAGRGLEVSYVGLYERSSCLAKISEKGDHGRVRQQFAHQLQALWRKGAVVEA